MTTINEDIQHPLYPKLGEEAEQEAQQLIDRFRERMAKVAEEVIGDLYVDIVPNISSDSWTNYRNQLLSGLMNYRDAKIQSQYDFKLIRRQIFLEYRDEIIKDLDQDNLARIAELERHIKLLEYRA